MQPSPVTISPAQPPITIASPSFPPKLIAVAADGTLLDKPGGHVAVLLPEFGLLASAGPLIKVRNWQAGLKAANEFRLLGWTDWRAGLPMEQLLLARHDRYLPAVDKEFFPHTPESGVVFTELADPSSPSDGALYVSLGSGGVHYGIQSLSGLVRPVRRVAAGQCLGLLAPEA